MGDDSVGVFDTFRRSEDRGAEHSDTARVNWAVTVIECFEAPRMVQRFLNQ
jgi:hypothetical protein